MATYQQFNDTADLSLNSVCGLTFDANGTLYTFVDTNSSTGSIYTLDASGNVSFFTNGSTPGSDLSLNRPRDFAIDASGNLYCSLFLPLSQTPPGQIVKVDTSGVVTTFADNNLNYPEGLVFDANGNLYCACAVGPNPGNGYIAKIDASATVTLFADGSILGSDASFQFPFGLVFDNNKEFLYCSNFYGNNIVKIDASGVVKKFTDNSLNFPTGLVFDDTGTLYCANSAGTSSSGLIYNNIVQIDSSGVVTRFTFPRSTGYHAVGIAYYNNYIYFAGNQTSFSTGPAIIYKTDDPVCFNHDTKILCLNHLLQEEYIPIQDLKKGDFVKTYLHGYRKIEYMYQSFMGNNPNKWNHCMYKMEKTEENGLLEDLILTGGHSIMVDSISEVEQERYSNIGLSNFTEENKIDEKYLLLASISEQFIPLTDNESYTIYHFCLKNNGDDTRRYGVWANGILTETPSKQYLINNKF